MNRMECQLAFTNRLAGFVEEMRGKLRDLLFSAQVGILDTIELQETHARHRAVNGRFTANNDWMNSQSFR